MSHLKRFPERSTTEEPSELYQIVLQHNQHPPIIQDTSWTLAVPFKEQRHHRTPSESIGNNYSPQARDLKIRNLQRKQGASFQGIPRDLSSS
ncbi:hypothetical protein JZ751_026277, partial [Albula glossodonta]